MQLTSTPVDTVTGIVLDQQNNPPPVTRHTRMATTPKRDIAELQTAETLLELHETLDIGTNNANLGQDMADVLPDLHNDDNAKALPVDSLPTADPTKSTGDANLLDLYDNANILPVGAPPLPDHMKEMEQDDHDNDSEETIPEPGPALADEAPKPVEHSPPGHFRVKEYGIRKNVISPKSKLKRYHCIICNATKDSKKELNDHHRKTHGVMSCVDCNKQFPTPDALQRHRYIHQPDREQYTCDICGQTSAFESDMRRHQAKHEDDKLWYCSNPNCDRTFKRKSDMTSHLKTHTNKDQKCPAQGCNYTNKDPRNLKRHMKCHSNEKPLTCPWCPARFKHYQQQKRHKENHE